MMHGSPASRCSGRNRPGASRLVGDPVDIVTGAVLDTERDFRLPDAELPLSFVRFYDSSRACDDSGIGRGFRHSLDYRLSYDLDGLSYFDPEAGAIEFTRLDHGRKQRSGAHVLERVGTNRYVVHVNSCRSYEFEFYTQQEAQLVCIRDAARELTLSYASRSSRLQTVGLGKLGQLRFDWDDLHLLRISLVEPTVEKEQLLVRYAYDAVGCLIEVENTYKHKLRYSYDEAQRMVRKVKRSGFAFCFTYDRKGRCVDARGEDGAEAVSLDYRPIERTTWVTRHDGGRWQYLYVDSGEIVRVLDPCGGMHAFNLDDNGRVIEEIDPLGNVTTILYDVHGNALTKADPWGHGLPLEHTQGAPHPLDHVTASTPFQYVYGSSFQAPGRMPSTDDTLWNVHWKARQSLQLTDPEWRGRVRRDYSVLGTPLHDRCETGATRRWAYNENGFLRWTQDFDGGRRTFQYQSDDHLCLETNEVGGQTRFEHSATAQLTALTDPNGTRSEYVLDEKDRVVEVHRHGRLRERYAYDAADNLVAKYDALGQLLLEHTIGPGNLKVARRLNNGELHGYRYDERGRLVEASAAAGCCTFSYDTLGRVTSDLRDGRGITYATELIGVSSSVFEKFVTRYRSTGRGKMTLHDPTGHQHCVQEQYPGLIERELGGKLRELTHYDLHGRCLLKALYHERDDDRPWVRSFHYSAEGDLLETRDSERGTTRYQYDAAHRLRCVLPPVGHPAYYEHDLADNLVSAPCTIPEARRAGVTQRLELRSGNRLHQVGGERFEYDDRDHLVLRHSLGGSTVYVRNALDQLITVRGPDFEQTAAYDALGRRTIKTVNGRTTTYYWDGDRLAAEIQPNGAIRVYVYGGPLALVPLMWVDYEADAEPESGQRRYLITDHLGSAERVLDEKGAVLWRAQLDPYGFAHVEVGEHFYQPLRFPGHFYDAATGLHYNRFRHYDPALCRYLESDPLGIAGGRNLYAYTRNPLRDVDVRGLAPNKNCKDCESKPHVQTPGDGASKESNTPQDQAVLPPLAGKQGERARRDQTPGDADFPSKEAALTEALRRHGVEPGTVETQPMFGKNPNLLGDKGEPWEKVRGLNNDGELVEIDHHANGHVFTDNDTFEHPHYHGPSGEHLCYAKGS